MNEVPQKIDKYQIRGILGSGAMGIVYEGFDPHIERRVAIKTLRKDLLANEDNGKNEFLQRFQREARAAAKCVHPNIVLILAYGEDNGSPFIVMEFVEGRSLLEIIRSHKKLTLQKTLSFIAQILKGLNAAHSKGIVHRDIKPTNIMVINNKTIKLADFGIARVANNTELTQVGAQIGTPRYMAPEQFLGGSIDQRADIFSVTLIIVDLLARLKCADTISLSNLSKMERLPANNRLDYSTLVPSAFIPVIEKGLSVNVEQRYKSIHELAQDLKSRLPHLADKTPRNSSAHDLADSVDTAHESTAINLYSGAHADTFELEADLEDFTGHLAARLNSNTFDRLKNDLGQYIGERAAERIRQESANAISIAEVINGLAKDIPKKKHRRQFIDRWTQ